MQTSMSDPTKPHVLIVGAGLGGCFLAILLELAGVPYTLYERSEAARPLGSAIALGCNVRRLFKQVGIWEEFKASSKPTFGLNISNTQREIICQIDLGGQKALGGSHMYVITRPVLYDILLRRVPKNKVQFGKKITSILQGEGQVKIGADDGSTYEGDILVGADGAYSAVRQCIYEKLEKQGTLPTTDSEPLPYRHVALIGQTQPLTQEDFPELLQEHSPSECIVGDANYGTSSQMTKFNTVCWQAFLTLDKSQSKYNDSFRNAEWGAEAAEQMCREVKDLPFRGANGKKTYGDLIELTPKHLITKVVFEEKVFKTWYSGRVVLMGDAVHKLHPAGGMGAVSAILDACTLANLLSVIHCDTDEEELIKLFKEYKDERLPVVMERFRVSQSNGALRSNTIQGRVARYVMNNLPKWAAEKAQCDHVRYRPQVSFLPLVSDEGSVEVAPQPSLLKTLEIHMSRQLQQQPQQDSAAPAPVIV